MSICSHLAHLLKAAVGLSGGGVIVLPVAAVVVLGSDEGVAFVVAGGYAVARVVRRVRKREPMPIQQPVTEGLGLWKVREEQRLVTRHAHVLREKSEHTRR